MEIVKDEKVMDKQAKVPRRKKGGLIAIPFIMANDSFEKVASNGLLPNMILYLTRDYNMELARGTNIIFYWSAATNFMPLLGAFISDSFLGRFLTIIFGSIASLLGTTLFWLTTMIPGTKPPSCNQSSQNCVSPNAAQLAMLISSFVLMSIGAGGIRPCALAFGADQLIKENNSKSERLVGSFFGWYYASSSISVLVALTAIVYIQERMGWKVGFGVPAILMLLATLFFLVASKLYVKRKASKSLLTGLVQVLVAAFKKRKLALPPHISEGRYHRREDSTLNMPTTHLRFLNKACMIKNPDEEIASDGSAMDPWNLCTVEQVEELKALIKVLPLWSTGIIQTLDMSQHTFVLVQAGSMDRHLTSGFQIPAGSFAVFGIITVAVWIAVYDRAIIPLASKIRGRPTRLGVKLRMGIGVFLSCMAMVVSAIVETFRRRKAKGLQNNPNAVVPMSAMWLAPQLCLGGLSEAFNAIAQIEFYYSEFPKSMSSIATSFLGLGIAFGNLLASVIVDLVDGYTRRGGKVSWVSKNINEGRYDYYYWILAVLCFINVGYFIICGWIYGPCAEELNGVQEEKVPEVEEELGTSGK
ncbi:Proton-dependent oligopeptide transporter family [Dillenia turbinata]|uniref:Proton-dependent oligopeptide transporter family n=1 Tax=Dillenia turbinata TaxID=194707 RepID=A0AAN8YZ55_9MAGN